jgi:lipopolysaccharide export LptBFGC system permease protein LptF
LENEYLDALLMAALAFGCLMLVSCIVIVTTSIMRRAMLYKEKNGGFKLRRSTKRISRDDKTKVVLAAAVAAYLKAEEASKR